MARLFSLAVWVALSGAFVALGTTTAMADRRVALVVGNAQYKAYDVALANPRNDAKDVADVLTSLGFEVITAVDVTKRDFVAALQRFARSASHADSALFFYAGHAMQYGGKNYLMPVDAELEDELSLRFNMVSMDDVRTALDQASGVKIMILDACRNNPLADHFLRTVVSQTRNFEGTRGLARVDKTQGMVVAYATAPDEVALDGEGRNSPFTSALLKRMREPGLEIEMMFRRVTADVNAQTGGRQRPETYISLLSEYYLNQNDRLAWEKIRDSDDLGELKEFITRFPASPLIPNAKQRIGLLEQGARDREFEERLEKLEADRKAREAAEADRQAKLEAEKKAVQEAAEQEATRKKEAAEKQAKLEAEQKAAREAAEQETTRKKEAAEKQAKLEAEQKAAREAAEQEATRKKEAAEKQAKLEAEQKAAREAAEQEATREKEAAEKQAKLEAEQKAAREAAQESTRKKEAAEKQAKVEAAQKAAQEAAEQEAARKEAAKKQAKLEAEQRAAREAVEQEAARKTEVAEKQAKLEAEQKAAREAAEQEAARKAEAAEKQAKLEAEQKAAREAAGQEAARKREAEEKQARLEDERREEPARPHEQGNTPELIRNTQAELRRIGCFSGKDDGVIGDTTIAALKDYLVRRGRPATEPKITTALLSDIEGETHRVCPLICPPGKAADSDRCIAERHHEEAPERPRAHHQKREREREAREPRPAPRQERRVASPSQPARVEPSSGALPSTHSIGVGF
jgi:hypothetical protein